MNLLLRTAAQDRPWVRLLWHGAAFVKHELAHFRVLPPSRHVRLLGHGFWSETSAQYGLDRNDHREYISDWAHISRCAYLNGPHWLLLTDKLWWDRAMGAFSAYLPALLGVLSSGRVYPLTAAPRRGSHTPRSDVIASLDRLLDEYDTLVLKPIRGGKGQGVHLLRRRQAGYDWNGQSRTPDELSRELSRLDRYLVMEFVRQHRYAAEIFPHTANTVRLLTMIDPETDEPFIAAAVHRFGTSRSLPTDNASCGGLSSSVSLEHGELGPAAVRITRQRQLKWHERHPETGARIAGVHLPNWPQLREVTLAAARHLSFCPYIGWDVVLTEGSPSIQFLEANDHCGPYVFQIHGGLLRDPRVRRFYEQHGVIQPLAPPIPAGPPASTSS